MTRRRFWHLRQTLGVPHWPSSMCIFPRCPPSPGTTPPTLTLFWKAVETRWCLGTLTLIIPPGSQEQVMIGQRLEGRPSMGRLTICSLLLQSKISLLASPPRDITLLSRHTDARRSTLTHLGYDHLPITVSLARHALLSQRKARCLVPTRTSTRLTGRDSQQS